VARVSSSKVRRRLVEAAKDADALTGLLRHIAEAMRQLVHVVGWVAILFGTVSLMLHPSVSLVHLLTPSAGALGVLQGVIKVRGGRR
jgi:hypothetical protein